MNTGTTSSAMHTDGLKIGLNLTTRKAADLGVSCDKLCRPVAKSVAGKLVYL